MLLIFIITDFFLFFFELLYKWTYVVFLFYVWLLLLDIMFLKIHLLCIVLIYFILGALYYSVV